jgi:pSer/pThr/pTyr-binding forkhead associated (FHA) protein
MPFLQKITTENPPQAFELSDKETTIGRSSRAAICIKLRDVSRLHAVVTFDGEHFYLSNRSSRSTTTVNDRVLTEDRRLRHGDIVKIGTIDLVFLDVDTVDVLSCDAKVSDRVIVSGPVEQDPDDSMQRTVVRAGDSTEAAGELSYDQRKIVASIAMESIPSGTLLLTDSAGKLSCVLRMIDAVRRMQDAHDLEIFYQSWFCEFPQAARLLLLETDQPGVSFRTTVAACQQAGADAILCPSLIHRAFLSREATLAWDLWRREDTRLLSSPGLSRMQRVSVLTVPIRMPGGEFSAVLQLVTGADRERFSRFDLERCVLFGSLAYFAIPLVKELISTGDTTGTRSTG